jgi:hypothetical protein
MSADRRGCTIVSVQIRVAEVPVGFAWPQLAALMVVLHALHAAGDHAGHHPPGGGCMPAPEHSSVLRDRLAPVEEHIAGLEAQPGAGARATLREWEQTRLQLEFAVQLLLEYDPAGASAMRDQIHAMERSFTPRRLALEAAAADVPGLPTVLATDDVQHVPTCSSTHSSSAARPH